MNRESTNERVFSESKNLSDTNTVLRKFSQWEIIPFREEHYDRHFLESKILFKYT